MAALRVFLRLALCLVLGHQTSVSARNDAPCQLSKLNNGYNTFVKRHIRSGLPSSLNHNEWFNYIKNNGGCDRPTQSFLSTSELDKVKAVCTNAGGVRYQENLCISRQPFTFVTVRSDKGTCGIKSVLKETKHLILACEKLDNQCVPVHFEGNPKYYQPENNAKGCQDPSSKGHTPNLTATWLPLLLLLLVVHYGF